MSVAYFKGGAVYFDLRFLVGKTFNKTISISSRSFTLLSVKESSSCSYSTEQKFFSCSASPTACATAFSDSWFFEFRVVIFIKVNFLAAI